MHKIQSLFLRKPTLFKLISSVIVLIVISALFVLINIKTPIPDSVIGLDIAPSKFLQYIFHYWSNVDLGQRVNGSTIAYLPVVLVYVALQHLGFSILQIQQIWFTTILSVAAISMFFFYRCWWKDSNITRGFIAGLIYGFSPFVLLNLKGASVLLLSYAVLPFLSFQLILVIRKQQIRYVIGAVIAGAILVPGINPPDNAIMFFGAALIGIGELSRQNWKIDGIKWMLFTWVFLILAAMWWIVPFVSTIGSGGASSYFITDPLSMDAGSSSFFSTLGLTGFWALYQGWNGIPYYPSQPYLTSSPISILMLLLPMVSFLAIRASWKDRGTRSLAWLIVVSVPMAVSIYPITHPSITGIAYEWIYNHLFFFRAFRSTYKWVALLSFSYAVLAPTLFGADYDSFGLKPIKAKWISKILSSSMGAVVNGIILGSIILFVVPFIRSWVFPKSYKLGTIPNYWYQATKWLDSQPGNGRVLFLPSMGFSNYNWGSPGGDIAQFLLRKPEITYQLGTPMPANLMNNLNQAPTNPSISLSKILYLLGVKYVVQRNDINYSYYGAPSPKKMNSYLSSKPFLHLVGNFGALSIYKSTLGGNRSVLGTAPTYESIVSDNRELSSELKIYRSGVLTKFGFAKMVYPKISKFTSSSVWNGLSSSYGPQMAFQATGSAWVSSMPGGVGQWLQADFKQPQKISKVMILGRSDGIDSLPTKLKVTAGNKSIVVPVSQNGEAKVNFHGIIVPNLRVTILSSGKGGPNVGIAQIIIKGIHPAKFLYPKIPKTSPIRYVFNFNSLIRHGAIHEIMGGGGRRVTLTGTIFSNPFMTNKVLSSYLIQQGVTSVSASSQWGDLTAYSPLWTISNSQSGSWVSNAKGGIGQWIRFDFPQKRWLGNITIQGRRNSFDAQATKIAIHLSNGIVEIHNLHWNNGTAVVPINRATKFLKIVILAHQPNKGLNVGFSKIYITGVRVKQNPKALLPPKLFLNGKPVALKMAKMPSPTNLVVGFSSWKFATYPIKLGYGKQLLQSQSNGLLTGNKLLLAAGSPSSAKINWLPQKKITQSSFESNVPPQKGYLFLSEQADPFWQASVGNRYLAKTGGADVYGELWKLPGIKGNVNVVFKPKTIPANWLITFGVASGLTILFLFSIWIIKIPNFYHNKIKKLYNKK